MQNQINPQYVQSYQGYNGIQPQSYPAYSLSPSVGAVNIQIYNPTANPQGFYQPVPVGYYPYNYNNNFNQMPNPSAQNQGQINPNMNQTMSLNAANNGVAAQGEGEEGKKTEEKKNKPKVALTDDYIRTLENYLNSQDKKIRLMGAKELFERFKEDETRKDDAALTALLNKTLQDPAETVKFIGLTALDAGYATGNNETAQILQAMQSDTSNYGEDAALASQILLKMSGYKANADAAALQNNQNANTGANLNQNQTNNMTMPEPSLNNQPQMNQSAEPIQAGQPALELNNQNGLNAVNTQLPPTDTDTLLNQNAPASMNQSMQINPNGQTDMNQSMVPPLNSSQAVA